MICHDQLFVRASTDLERDNHGIKQALEKQPSATAAAGYVHIKLYTVCVSKLCRDKNVKRLKIPRPRALTYVTYDM